MEYFGIKEVEGKAVINDFTVKKKQRKKNMLNFAVWSLGALNVIAYALIAIRLF